MTDKHKAWCDLFDGQDICTCGLTELLDTKCPHGFVRAENVCGPCSEGRPNSFASDAGAKSR